MVLNDSCWFGGLVDGDTFISLPIPSAFCFSSLSLLAPSSQEGGFLVIWLFPSCLWCLYQLKVDRGIYTSVTFMKVCCHEELTMKGYHSMKVYAEGKIFFRFLRKIIIFGIFRRIYDIDFPGLETTLDMHEVLSCTPNFSSPPAHQITNRAEDMIQWVGVQLLE